MPCKPRAYATYSPLCSRSRPSRRQTGIALSSLKLLGFVPREQIKPEHVTKLEKKLVDGFKKSKESKITNDYLKDYLKQKHIKTTGMKKVDFLDACKEQLTKDGKLDDDD